MPNKNYGGKPLGGSARPPPPPFLVTEGLKGCIITLWMKRGKNW